MEEIYQEYAEPVYQYLCSLTHHADTAQELTAETFLQAVKSMKRYNGECRLLVWLCQIARHLWYQELDRRKRKGASSLDAMPEQCAADGSPEEALLVEESRVLLFRRMQELDETTREVVYLRLMGDLSYRQIGDVLGKTENWARVTFYRGKEKLRKGWDEHV
jgi:RNA polymerase sigma-70 factor (ECF subfamily)